MEELSSGGKGGEGERGGGVVDSLNHSFFTLGSRDDRTPAPRFVYNLYGQKVGLLSATKLSQSGGTFSTTVILRKPFRTLPSFAIFF